MCVDNADGLWIVPALTARPKASSRQQQVAQELAWQ
jgi:hypothetical protein